MVASVEEANGGRGGPPQRLGEFPRGRRRGVVARAEVCQPVDDREGHLCRRYDASISWFRRPEVLRVCACETDPALEKKKPRGLPALRVSGSALPRCAGHASHLGVSCRR